MEITLYFKNTIEPREVDVPLTTGMQPAKQRCFGTVNLGGLCCRFLYQRECCIQSHRITNLKVLSINNHSSDIKFKYKHLIKK